MFWIGRGLLDLVVGYTRALLCLVGLVEAHHSKELRSRDRLTIYAGRGNAVTSKTREFHRAISVTFTQVSKQWSGSNKPCERNMTFYAISDRTKVLLLLLDARFHFVIAIPGSRQPQCRFRSVICRRCFPFPCFSITSHHDKANPAPKKMLPCFRLRERRRSAIIKPNL